MNERDTHFANYAHMLYMELDPLFAALHAAQLVLDYSRAGQIREEIKMRLDYRACDLVAHVLGNAENQWKPLEEISVRDIPDLRAWSD